MVKFIYALVLFALVASEAPTEQERKGLLDFHNEKRGAVDPPATNMLEMGRSPNNDYNWFTEHIEYTEHNDYNEYTEYNDYNEFTEHNDYN
ncbi:hypothetical protein EmuJ_000682600 [Echinococcus multilocularis]|uniref:SCP domain-containing protein n=1 Tax=Echinococcus multilocularis TaxID=6211 RepID=A0A068YAT0_ECHMU|nr:hypothetical protein EmuJ_000682600 [Echinococcus multilocularis]